MAVSKKSSYKITNWREYNESLVNRGDITFWFCEDVIENWQHENDRPKVGRPYIYSDTAIECMLMLRELFRLPYRQTEGLGRALIRLMRLDLAIPDFTSLAKRAAKMNVSLSVKNRQGPIDVVVDSTGLKVFGEGEWKMRTHGKSKRRTWRKLHLAINPETHEIEAQVLTENSGHDADQVNDLIDQVEKPIGKFYGDGSYDQWKVYDRLQKENMQAIIPPRKDAKIKQHGNCNAEPLDRDEAIRTIHKKGRKEWKKEIGYHQRSLAETAMFRMKSCFGNKLKNRKFENQKTEVSLRCKILNLFTSLGMPEFVWN
jgi:hypothetical protein